MIILHFHCFTRVAHNSYATDKPVALEFPIELEFRIFIFKIETSHFFPWFHLRFEQILSILLSDWHQSWINERKHLEIIIPMYIVLEFYSNNYSIDFYEVLVDKFFGLINFHLIEISSSESNQ